MLHSWANTYQGPVHTTLEEFENGAFTRKRMKCCQSTIHRRNLNTQRSPQPRSQGLSSYRLELALGGKMRDPGNEVAITGHFGFVVEENSGREITWSSWRHRFRKAAFSKCFPSTLKRKAAVFKFLRFEERFQKAPFPWRVAGADPGFDEGGSAKRPPKVVAPRGARGHAPPKKF